MEHRSELQTDLFRTEGRLARVRFRCRARGVVGGGSGVVLGGCGVRGRRPPAAAAPVSSASSNHGPIGAHSITRQCFTRARCTLPGPLADTRLATPGGGHIHFCRAPHREVRKWTWTFTGAWGCSGRADSCASTPVP